ncbi:MAG: GxxExxY protein [Patescibacteria group bacterium]|nr:GxxExxY protein [Patescibacteria group bacterium]MDD4610923.1 GxxExxY protein [Patescibacteria group bacterium]
MEKVIYKELSYKINGLLYKVHNDLGRYRNEKQYGDYFEELLKQVGYNYLREYKLDISFTGEKNGRNICDFIIEGKIIVELKAKIFITQEDYFQLKRYLSCSRLHLGILVNFRQHHLSIKRVINNELLQRHS